jgi:hypothetical protein
LRIVVVMARRLSSSPAVLATPSTIGCNGLYPSSVCPPVPFISVVTHALCSTRTKNTSRDRNVFFYHDRLHALYHDCGSPALLSWRDNRKQASGIEDDRENSQDLAERTVGGIMILRRPNR